MLTKYGTREILFGCVAYVGLSYLTFFASRYCRTPALLWLLIPYSVVFLWKLWFFRDPKRTVPDEAGIIVSPADGTVTHLDSVNEDGFIDGKALRCSIFLSIFSVHLNRAPVKGVVAYKKFREGGFYDARREESLEKNQNMDLGLATDGDGLPKKVMVRQSTGAIARRIVCPVEIDAVLNRGEKYGMIKFGSRTTLYLSDDSAVEWLVKIGDKVKAGETILARVK